MKEGIKVKKIFSLILAIMMCASISSCGGDNSEYTELGGTSEEQQQQEGLSQDFYVINKLGGSIKEFYVSQSNTADWGENLLGNLLLEDGVKLDISFTGAKLPSTVFDIAVIMEDGTEHQFTNVDVSVSKAVELQIGESGPVASMQPQE